MSDLISECSSRVSPNDPSSALVFIDCNPSFAAYTELAMIAAERLIVPCSSDGSSARAIDSVGSLLYGLNVDGAYGDVNFRAKTNKFKMPLPRIHAVLLNRSTLYSAKASKAFEAMFDEIKRRTRELQKQDETLFTTKKINFNVVPDNHSVAIVCSHLGKPLYDIKPGKYEIHDTNPQVNTEPLDRYKEAVAELISLL